MKKPLLPSNKFHGARLRSGEWALPWSRVRFKGWSWHDGLIIARTRMRARVQFR